jgi:hydroxymethylbilane synthase
MDAFVSNHYRSLDDLPQGARLGTSSLRRKCQIQAYRPDLSIIDLRGNVGTRLGKLDAGQYDAIILAAAGLKRLQLENRIQQVLSPSLSLPAVGQGALGLECRSNDQHVLTLIAPLSDPATSICIKAERAFNRSLQGGCQVPIAGFAVIENEQLYMQGRVGSPDGKQLIKAEITGAPEQAEQLGEQLAQQLLTQGAGAILAALYA